MASLGFIDGVRREIARMGSRPAYLIGMIIIPLAVTLFFVSLLSEGLAQRLPTAVVDYDHSPMSRQVTRTIEASQLMDVRYHVESYDKAMEKVRSGEVFGFFVIPANFESDALGGRTPTLEYFSNMTYFVPGTLVTKGFKTVAVTTSGGVVRNTLVSLGVDPERIGGMLQPVVFDINPLANPWMNYSIYLTPSYTMATYALMIMLMTVLSVCGEIKDGTSRQWLAHQRGAALQAAAAHDSVLGGRPVHNMGVLRLAALSHERLAGLDDSRHLPARRGIAGVRAVRLLGIAQSANGIQRVLPFRRAVLLLHRLRHACGQHVRRHCRLFVDGTGALLVPGVLRQCPQRLSHVLLAPLHGWPAGVSHAVLGAGKAPQKSDVEPCVHTLRHESIP